MNKFKLAFTMFSIVVLVGGALLFSVSRAEQGVIRVPYDYPTIQEAVNAASAESIIMVSSRTYTEHIVIDKPLKLIGEERMVTILDGGGNGTVIKVEADNVLVDGFTIRNGKFGIYMSAFSNLIISNNIIIANDVGICLNGETGIFGDSLILRNIIANNGYNGISSDYNGIYENFVSSRFEFVGCRENVIRHNNFFIYNGILEDMLTGNNTWNENFWNSGVYREDKQPLNAPYGPIPILWENVVYPVSLVSNSTVSGIEFSQANKKIEFYFQGTSGTTGFFNMTIPKNLLRGEPWTILMGLEDITPQTTIIENETHTTIGLTYTHGSTEGNIRIIGTWVVPEFASSIILSILMILFTALTVAIKLKKRGLNK